MKATVNRQALIQALSQIAATFSVNTKTPQKDSVCIIAANNQLEIQSLIQQPDIGVLSTNIPAIIDTEGNAFIFGKKLFGLVKLMSGDNITLETLKIEYDDTRSFAIFTAVSDGKSNYQISGTEFKISNSLPFQQIFDTHGTLTFPQEDLGLTTGFKSWTGMTPCQKQKFDERMSRTVKIGDKEMTRLEAVEGIAKEDFDETAVRLNAEERKYLQFIKEMLIQPLMVIEEALLQQYVSEKSYYFLQTTMLGGSGIIYPYQVEIHDRETHKEISLDMITLERIKKLADILGGNFNGEKFVFKEEYGYNSKVFARAANLFTSNEHLKYFKISSEKQLTSAVETENSNTTAKFTCNVKDFKTAVEKVIGSTEEFNYLIYEKNLKKVLVNFKIAENVLTLQATNFQKLSKTPCEIDNPDNISTEFNLYNIVLETIMPFLKKSDEIKFQYSNNGEVFFEIGALKILTLQPQNFNYPDTSSYFTDIAKTAVVKTEELVYAVKASALIAKDNPKKAVYLRFDKEEHGLEIKSYSSDGSFVYWITAEIYADAEIIINLEILDGIKKIQTKEMIVSVQENTLFINDTNNIDKHVAMGMDITLDDLRKDCPIPEETAQIEPPTIDITAEVVDLPAQVTKFEIGKTYKFVMEGISDNLISAEFTATDRTDNNVTFSTAINDKEVLEIETECGIEKISSAVWTGNAENFVA